MRILKNKIILFSNFILLGIFQVCAAGVADENVNYGNEVYIKNYKYLGVSGNKLMRKETSPDDSCHFRVLASVDNPNEKKGQPVKYGDSVYFQVVKSSENLYISLLQEKIYLGEHVKTFWLFGVGNKQRAACLQIYNEKKQGKPVAIGIGFRLKHLFSGAFMTWREPAFSGETFLDIFYTDRTYRQGWVFEKK